MGLRRPLTTSTTLATSQPKMSEITCPARLTFWFVPALPYWSPDSPSRQLWCSFYYHPKCSDPKPLSCFFVFANVTAYVLKSSSGRSRPQASRLMAMVASGALGGGHGDVEKGRGRLRGLPFDSPGFYVHSDHYQSLFKFVPNSSQAGSATCVLLIKSWLVTSPV